MSQYDTQSLYEFLFHTPESGLRRMLVDRQNMTDVHCNLLLKIVKGSSIEAFAQHFEKQDFPRVRMTAAEEKIKEKFWTTCVATLLERGILQPATAGQAVKEAA